MNKWNMTYRILITHKGNNSSQRVIWMGTISRMVAQIILRIIRDNPKEAERAEDD